MTDRIAAPHLKLVQPTQPTQPAQPAHDAAFPVRRGDDGLIRISPTDVSQYIRLEQCARYLRLRLHQRTDGLGFMTEQGLAPQQLPALLSRSGADFEEQVYTAIGTLHAVVDFAVGKTAQAPPDNDRLLALIADLAPGGTVIATQPMLVAALGDWKIRGAVDLIRIDRAESGALSLLILDIKSSARVKVEYFLQVAFYAEMLDALVHGADPDAGATIDLGILYRGPAEGDTRLSEEDIRTHAAHRAASEATFGTGLALLDLVANPRPYRDAVHDLVTGPQSTAQQLAREPFDALNFHLTSKCDNCIFHEFCLRRSADTDDLSLLPLITDRDKIAFQRNGVQTVAEVAVLKDQMGDRLVTSPAHAPTVRKLSGTWPIGSRLDEIVHRARRYRKYKGDPLDSLSYIPDSGYSSLPASRADLNPNLVLIYLDAQHDHLEDRIYQLGALVVGHDDGHSAPERRRTIVHTTDGPPNSIGREGDLFIGWIDETLAAIAAVAAPDADGLPKVPIHLVFYDAYTQKILLDGLARHHGRVLATTPLYDFVTQVAAYDSPILTHLESQIRAQKNYPLLAQTLQAVSNWLKFSWDPEIKAVFRHRIFDSLGRTPGTNAADPEEGSAYYVRRARFSSQVPLEYAYAAWNDLPRAWSGTESDRRYLKTTPELLAAFAAQRLDAIEHIASDLSPNPETSLSTFAIPDLAGFESKAENLAHALEEFVIIERHAQMSAWKSAHLPPPERRALAGDTLIVRYLDEDQDPAVVEQNRKNETLRQKRLAIEQAIVASGESRPLTKTEKAETNWTMEGMRVRLRIETDGVDASLPELLALTQIRPGERVILHPRLMFDSRRPQAEQKPLTPTGKALLYGMRADIEQVVPDRFDADGRPNRAIVTARIVIAHGRDAHKFTFGTMGTHDRPLIDGDAYTLGPDPNDFYGAWCAKVVHELNASGQDHALYRRLERPDQAVATWPEDAAAAQARFFAGLEALHAAGAFFAFEESKRDYIGRHGDVPTLMVQGPPGTGKSFTSGFAILARMQGAMAAGRDYRVILSCKTHAATDVLLGSVVDARQTLARLRTAHPAIFAEYFDPRLLEIPNFRIDPREGLPETITPIRTKHRRRPGDQKGIPIIEGERWCMVGATPGGVYNLINDRWGAKLFGHHLIDALVLDEASQMNLPEAMMAALPLKLDGHLIVVGDHRQMPPIVKHNWGSEPRRTFREFRSFESLFLTLLPMMDALEQPIIRFAESFRLHAEMAEFLRQEIYHQDGIAYHSRKTDVIARHPIHDAFQAAVLDPDYPMIVVVHDEASSIQRNPFEHTLIRSLLETLADPDLHALNAEHGIGVVVPHRAQRADLQNAVPQLTLKDPDTGRTIRSAVDTVERFQGGERTVIMVGATESERSYLVGSPDFLLDPRRLTVALSRAKEKMILVASRSIFDLFSADDELFENAQLWKNLLRRTCTVPLWSGMIDGHVVQVWGNAPRLAPSNGHAHA